MSALVATDADGFSREVRDSAVPVLVDFWAPWCARCRQLAPALDDLASRLDGRAKVVTVDVEANPSLAQEHLVLSLPAVAVYRQGELVTTLHGLQSTESLASLVEEVLL